MTLSEYLEHLTENNWHTLRELIELERDTLSDFDSEQASAAYDKAREHLLAASGYYHTAPGNRAPSPYSA
jgi:hypothetical protein